MIYILDIESFKYNANAVIAQIQIGDSDYECNAKYAAARAVRYLLGYLVKLKS